MAILVNLPMPETCVSCPFVFYSNDSNGTLLNRHTTYTDLISKRRDDCPIVEVWLPKKADYTLLAESGFEL